MSVDYDDVQGLVRYAFGHLPDACYLLVKIKDADSAKTWLRSAAITSARESKPPPPTALQVGFTADGLRALGVPTNVVSQFSPEFVGGMAGSEARSRRLGDTGANAPQTWQWGYDDRQPHVLVALFAASGALEAIKTDVRSGAWTQAFDEIDCLDTTNLNGVEEFGFTDGISQPSIDWEQQRELRGDKLQYGNTVALGEFLLGYRNEYNCYTERPLLDAGGPNDDLPAAEDDTAKRDAGRNGTYLVMRDLRQDVRAFWRFAKEERLASAFVGRKMNGDPLVVSDGQNDFTYDRDPSGVRCPFGAHIRRANPRNADFPAPPRGPIATLWQMLGLRKASFHDDLISSVRFHRIVRRGREFGPKLSPQDAQLAAPEGDPPRGLRFACVCANIERQFEFVQNAWMMSETFNGLYDESDPLLGCSDSFVVDRADAARTRVTGLPQFITVTGGAYFFLPGLRTLRYFTQVRVEGAS